MTENRVELSVGDYVRIKRIWVNQPDSYVEGVIISFSKTRWEENYRIVELLQADGKVVNEPLDIVRDFRSFEIIHEAASSKVF